MVSYVTAVLAFVRAELFGRGTSIFCDFGKSDLLWFHPILLLFDSTKHLFIEMYLVRSTIAKLCPNIIHFSVLDFSECRSEEVISFFWRSV